MLLSFEGLGLIFLLSYLLYSLFHLLSSLFYWIY
ncbi:hypothetical protein N197_04265 [Helicobacter pylori UM023]|nr:hypothetical protein N197_01735 [Helicobacter pylori UM023]EPZ68192.1 hypothetical protein N197_07810 [Helicobacter pylori UM023]EPZ68253.1 hypothetical protein N197_07795 [Helicobacter pylori UM023]EPZ69853.1 hypothetical protein N197_04265 [Helicobacter pylori UM023]